MFPLQYAVYKGTGGKFGALQFNLQRPHYVNGKQRDFTGAIALEEVDGRRKLEEGWKERPGCVFLEITSTKDGQKNVYDWDQKVIMALSVNDMGKILLTLATGQECKIMHDPNAKGENQGAIKKWLTVTSPKGTIQGVMFSVSMNAAGDERRHTVPLTGDEVMVLRTLLQQAINRSVNW
jgi:hypothetical protein